MNKKIIRLITILVAFFFMASTTHAEVERVFLRVMDDSMGHTVYRNFDGNKKRQLSIEIGTSNSTAVTGYCLDVGASLTDKAAIEPIDGNLESYLTKMLNNKEKAVKVTKKINEYIQFGYKYNGQNSDKYLIATQKLIWDELYKAGYRQEHYANNVYFTAGGQDYDITTEENNIKNNINNYYKTPSMCSSSNKLEIATGETVTYEDKNNVLSNYKVNCDNSLKCQIEGNKLKVTASAEGTEYKITFNKEGMNGSSNVIYQRSDEQTVVVNANPIEGISCQFGIDTYKNVQTSDMKIIYIGAIGLFSGVMAYIAYYTKKTLN